MEQTIQRNKLFVASCLALLVTSLSFGIRAGLLDTWGYQFGLTGRQIGYITSTAFWGFPVAIVIGGFIVDVIGMKRLLLLAFILHFLGIILTVIAKGFWPLYLSTLLIGIGNGTVEAACNPLVTSLFTDNKTTKLSHFHLWFPGGIVIGTLIVAIFGSHIAGTDYLSNWRVLVALMLIPNIIYGFLFYRLHFPVTERVAAGVPAKDMYKAVLTPLFICMIILMFGTAITELFTGQWIGVLLGKLIANAVLILALTAGVQTLGRAFAGPVVHKFSPTGVLLISAILSALGIYMMATQDGALLIVGAFIFGMGVTYFWPTMLGFVSENIPKSGALGLNLMGGAGMFAVSIYMIFMGGYYDNIITHQLPSGANLETFRTAKPGTDAFTRFAHAQLVAGPQILKTTLIIPLILIVAFAVLLVYMRGRKKKELLVPSGSAAA